MPGTSTSKIAKNLLAFRDTDKNGVLTSLDELTKVEGATPAFSPPQDTYSARALHQSDVEIVGPKVGGELRNQAIRVTSMLWQACCYILHSGFQWCTEHGGDRGFSRRAHHPGLFKIFGFEISLTVIAALLTLVGYSMNDTIVIFDRIREKQACCAKSRSPTSSIND